MLQTETIGRFTNPGRCPVCILAQCYNARFDVSTMLLPGPNVLDHDRIPWCLAWGMLGMTRGGAVAALSNGNTCYGVPGDGNSNGVPDDAERFGGFLGVEFFLLYGQEGLRTLGDIHAESLRSYWTLFSVHSDPLHCKSLCEWMLIGDPSLRVGGFE